MFDRFRQSGRPEDLIADLTGRAYSQRPVMVGTADLTATRDVHGPVVPEQGLTLDSVWLTSTAALPTTFTFQAFFYLKGTRRYLAPPVVTTGVAVAAGVPFRLHKAERLKYPIPAGAVLGVTVTRASGTLTLPTFTFVLTGG